MNGQAHAAGTGTTSKTPALAGQLLMKRNGDGAVADAMMYMMQCGHARTSQMQYSDKLGA